MAAKLETFSITLVGSEGGSELVLVRDPNSLNVGGRWKQWPGKHGSVYYNGPITGQQGDYEMWARYVENNPNCQKDMVALIKRAVSILQQIPMMNEEGTVEDTRQDEVKQRAIYPDGTPFPSTYCLMPDHYLTTFAVTVRSKFPVAPDVIKDTIQLKQEVVSIHKAEEVCVASNPKR